jgi:hypothetical protein
MHEDDFRRFPQGRLSLARAQKYRVPIGPLSDYGIIGVGLPSRGRCAELKQRCNDKEKNNRRSQAHRNRSRHSTS